ncbi:MAG: group II intron reverse transcriptase domain-containing protein [Planctomycetes bacterium]|nr:group II intron reverse transcriptase domain-containing protein [Planctomycetota bacterium]
MRSRGGLFGRIADPANLEAAMRRAALGKHGRGPVRRLLAGADREFALLRDEILSGAYRPRPYLQFRVMDPKPRTISCADFRDRVVHHAICAVVAPVFERSFISDSFACRAGKGAHRAVLRAQRLSRRRGWCLKGDIRRFYDSVDHAVLIRLLERKVREPALRHLLRVIVEHPLPGQNPGKGLPIGNLTSQWFANLYLDRLDHEVKDRLGCRAYVRYMDDFVAWDARKDRLFDLWGEIRAFLAEQLRLELKEAGTFIAPVEAGVPFLGLRVFPGLLRLQRARLRRMRSLIARREGAHARGEISAEDLARSAGASFGMMAFFGMRVPVASAHDA